MSLHNIEVPLSPNKKAKLKSDVAPLYSAYYIVYLNEFNFLGPPLLPSFLSHTWGTFTTVCHLSHKCSSSTPPPPQPTQLARELGSVRTTHHAWHVSCQ